MMRLLRLDEETREPALQVVKRVKLPMHKDPVFLAELRKSIIQDHNRMVESKKASADNERL